MTLLNDIARCDGDCRGGVGYFGQHRNNQTMNTDTPETDAALAALFERDGELSEENAPAVLVKLCKSLERELAEAQEQRDTLAEAFDMLDNAFQTMRPRYSGHPSMDGRYPCWFVWMPHTGTTERKSLKDAVFEYITAVKTLERDSSSMVERETSSANTAEPERDRSPLKAEIGVQLPTGAPIYPSTQTIMTNDTIR